MTECVLVPTFQRSDMLYCTLEAIRALEPNVDIHLFPDRGTDERDIANRFNAIHHLTWQHTYHGNSANVLEAMKFAYEKRYETAFIIEDDAIVDKTFFEWCRKALEREDLFAACGWRFSPDMQPQDGPDAIIPWYLSVATALPRRSLYGIVQHAKPEYYSRMQKYLDEAYPNSNRRGTLHYEQDGLVLRVCESQSKYCAWPRRPRATHVGWRGYHMPQGADLKGTLEDRVKVIKLLMKNPAMLKSMLNGGIPPEVDYCSDCKQPLLSANKAAKVICVECFHVANPTLPRTATSHYYLPTEGRSLSVSEEVQIVPATVEIPPEKPKGKRGNPYLKKGERPYTIDKASFQNWLDNHPAYERKSRRSGQELARAFLHEKTTLKGQSTNRERAFERIHHIMNALFTTATNTRARNQVAAAQMLLAYAYNKPPTAEADLDAMKKGGLTLVYVNRPQIDPEIPVAPQQALEAAPPEFIENEVTSE